MQPAPPGLCGTGLASGTATVTSPEGTFTVSYNIAFSAGVGTIFGTSNDPDSDTFFTHTVTGMVILTPTGTDPPSNRCAASFIITGWATVAE
jgi:hypothetical protein